MKNTSIYIDSVLVNLPTSIRYLIELRKQLRTDGVYAQVIRYCEEGWPDRNQLQGSVNYYWHERPSFSV